VAGEVEADGPLLKGMTHLRGRTEGAVVPLRLRTWKFVHEPENRGSPLPVQAQSRSLAREKFAPLRSSGS